MRKEGALQVPVALRQSRDADATFDPFVEQRPNPFLQRPGLASPRTRLKLKCRTTMRSRAFLRGVIAARQGCDRSN